MLMNVIADALHPNQLLRRQGPLIESLQGGLHLFHIFRAAQADIDLGIRHDKPVAICG
jgi:hypothetical protein